MVAIISTEPTAPARHLPPARPARPVQPHLRLVPAPTRASGPTRTIAPWVVPVAGVALLLLAIVGAIAVGRGALAGLAPAPARASASSPAAVPAGATTVEVQVGDSLWTIARRLQPTGDVRALVDRLVALNGTTVVQPGDRVVVPS